MGRYLSSCLIVTRRKDKENSRVRVSLLFHGGTKTKKTKKKKKNNNNNNNNNNGREGKEKK